MLQISFRVHINGVSDAVWTQKLVAKTFLRLGAMAPVNLDSELLCEALRYIGASRINYGRTMLFFESEFRNGVALGIKIKEMTAGIFSGDRYYFAVARSELFVRFVHGAEEALMDVFEFIGIVLNFVIYGFFTHYSYTTPSRDRNESKHFSKRLCLVLDKTYPQEYY